VPSVEVTNTVYVIERREHPNDVHSMLEEELGRSN
jgi:hypothetical protein